MVRLCAYRYALHRISPHHYEVIEMELTVTFFTAVSSARIVSMVTLPLVASNWNPLVCGQLLVLRRIQSVMCNLLCICDSTPDSLG